MSSLGIIRRVDDLGRIAIPKEIRRAMRIKEGDPLEIFATKEGEITLKPFKSSVVEDVVRIFNNLDISQQEELLQRLMNNW